LYKSNQFPYAFLVPKVQKIPLGISLPLFAGDAVVNVYINQEKRFAFVEMRTVEEASNAMALDGIIYEVVIHPNL